MAAFCALLTATVIQCEESARTMAADENDKPGQTVRRRYRERIFRNRLHLFGMPTDFVTKHYRLDPSTILYVLSLVEEQIEGVSACRTAIPPLLKLTAVLEFCGTGSFQAACALSTGISQPAFSRILTQVLKAFMNILKQFIHFPTTPAEMQEVKKGFYDVASFPDVVGCIDGTHIALVPPHANEVVFRNSKNFHSINVQMVCDATLMIRQCCANFPGSADDSFVLRSSSVPALMSSMRDGNNWLLGDRAYELKPWLLTPILDPKCDADRNYNMAHMRTHKTVEQTFALLKSRFRCLHSSGGSLMYAPRKVCQIVGMCAILHNIAIARRVPDPDDIVPDVDVEDEPMPNVEGIDGASERQNVVNNFFS